MRKITTFFLHSALCILPCINVFAAVKDGYVVKADSGTVYLDWGTASGVHEGDSFTLYRAGEALKHPVTGEILGNAETRVGAGTVQSVEEKFSIGSLDTLGAAARVGDRSRLSTSIPIPAVVPSFAALSASTMPAAAMPAEIWRSDPLEKEPVGLAFGDLDGDGKQDILIAYRKKIQVFRWVNKRLEPLGSYDSRSFRHWLAVDIAQVQPNAPAAVFATAYIDGMNRPRIVVLRYQDGVLKNTAEFEGFARGVSHADGRRPLFWQSLSRARSMSYTAVSELQWEKEKYKPGPPIDLKLFDDQLFGFVWGDWDKDGQEDFAVMEHGERIRILTQDAKWKSSEVFGGTKNDFSYDEQTQGSFLPRMLRWRPAGSDRDQLVLSTNHPDLGVRMTYLKLFKKSEIEGLAWNGLEMKSQWSVAIQGYLADFGIVDAMGTGTPQLWALAAGPGDKTVLLSYTLP